MVSPVRSPIGGEMRIAMESVGRQESYGTSYDTHARYDTHTRPNSRLSSHVASLIPRDHTGTFSKTSAQYASESGSGTSCVFKRNRT